MNSTATTSRARNISLLSCGIILAWFYLIIPGYGPGREQSLLHVLYDSWNTETRYEHGVMFPFIILGLFAYQWKNIMISIREGEWQALLLIGIGCLLYVAAHRVIQWRVGIASLPFIVSGIIWYLCGRRTFFLTVFPVFYLWLSIPVPDIQQATLPLQTISISMAKSICSLFGVETYASGAKIFSATQKWNPLTVDEMCSGIRSLMALLMISCAWAYLAKMTLWKRAMLIVSALPIAILGNGLRVASIFVIAEYGDEKFAQKTWHDHSGLLLFYPISLLLMMALHTLLEGGFPWKQQTIRRTVVRTQSISPVSQP